MLAKTKVKHSFAAASTSYDKVALLQRRVGKKLISHIEVINQDDTLIDLGCGTGFIIEELLQQQACKSSRLIALDITHPMLQTARKKLNNIPSVTYLCADIECLPLQAQSIDWVISNLAFQWCGNLAAAFADIKQILKREGQFLFTTFGAGTLQELKTAWGVVDKYAHVNAFYTTTQVENLLQNSGFKQFEVTTESYVSSYKSVWQLMAELKQLGAHTVMAGGNKRFTSRATMERMINAYTTQDEGNTIPATFEIITAIVKA
jgi:malonyl-CoA O-methyltransferase